MQRDVRKQVNRQNGLQRSPQAPLLALIAHCEMTYVHKLYPLCNCVMVDLTFSVGCHINATWSNVIFDILDIFAQMHNTAVIFIY